MIILLAIFFLVSVTFWIFEKEEGITVQPFETVGIEENSDGKPFATLLSFDLQMIKNVYSGQDLPVISKSNSENKTTPRPLGDFSIPSLSNFKNLPLEYSISQIGTVGAGGTSISIGNFLVSIKEFLGNKANTITCSLQRYNSTMIIIAILEDQTDTKSGFMTFEETNASNAEQIPNLINDLAYQISLALSKRGAQPKKDDLYPLNWQTFKYVTQGRAAYNSYIITKEVKDLDRGKYMASLARNFEPSYKNTFELLSALGFAYLQCGKYDEAANIFRNITESKPFESALGLGVVYYNQDNYTGALNAFKEATKLNPQDAYAWNNEGVILNKMGKYREAVETFNNTTRLDPQDAVAWNNEGNALVYLGQKEKNSIRYEEAIKAYSKAIEIKSQDSALYAAAWNGKGTAFNALGEYNKSIQACDKAIEIDPKHVKAWLNKGNALNALGKYDEAIQAYDKAIEIDPNDANAWNNKGVALKSLGRNTDAETAFAKAKGLVV